MALWVELAVTEEGRQTPPQTCGDQGTTPTSHHELSKTDHGSG